MHKSISEACDNVSKISTQCCHATNLQLSQPIETKMPNVFITTPIASELSQFWSPWITGRYSTCQWIFEFRVIPSWFRPSGGPSHTHTHPRSFMENSYVHESHRMEPRQVCSYDFQMTLTITSFRTRICHTLDRTLLIVMHMQAHQIIIATRAHIFT